MGAHYYVKRLDQLGCFDIAQIVTTLKNCINTHSLKDLRQINLTAKTAESEPVQLTQGVGSFYDRQKQQWFDSDSDYRFLNTIFRNTEIERYFLSLKALGYEIGRMRLMRMPPKTCYSLHKDEEDRIHLPLITHPMAQLQFFTAAPQSNSISRGIKNIFFEARKPLGTENLKTEVSSYHLPAVGESFLTQTTLPHSALNMSDLERWHIVTSVRLA